MREILIVGLTYLSFLFVISGASFAAPVPESGSNAIPRAFAPSSSVQAVQYALPDHGSEAGGSSTRHSLENGSDRGVARCNQGKIYQTDKEICLNEI